MVDSLTDGLKVRHLTMMGLGSAIGAGLFLGTGAGIAAADPPSSCPTPSPASS